MDQITRINYPSQIQSLRLPQHVMVTKISKLTYINAGKTIVALNVNGVHLLWNVVEDKDQHSTHDHLSIRKGSLSSWESLNSLPMTNSVYLMRSFEEIVPCFSFFKDNKYLVSASGASISCYFIPTHRELLKFEPIHTPPQNNKYAKVAPTAIVFHPKDYTTVFIGMEDNYILEYNFTERHVLTSRLGHSERVTGLAITDSGDLLVSTGADAQICLWSIKDDWSMKRSVFLWFPQRTPPPPSDTLVELNRDQAHILVVHRLQVAQYEIRQLARLNQWVVPGSCAYITHATYSCDNVSVIGSPFVHQHRGVSGDCAI